MNMNPELFFKSVLEADRAPVVLCDLSHTIVYMNPAASVRYAQRGGEKLVGQSLLRCHTPEAAAMIQKVVAWFASDRTHNSVYEFYNDRENKDVYMIALRDGDGNLIGYYEKHEYRNRETAPFYDFCQDSSGGTEDAR